MTRFLPVVTRRVPSDSRFAELYLTPGPQQIGVTGDNSYNTLYGRNWLLVWDRIDNLIHAYQEDAGGEWVEILADLPPVFGSAVPAGARRWSLTFDQSARAVVAFEDADGVIRVTRWDPAQNQYVQNVSFSGVDPCVVIDASWSFSIPGSDVLLFYLSADRERVMCRVQRDVYGTEYELWDYGAPVILDRVIALPYRYQVLVSDAAGAPLPEVLVSALYPVAVATGVQLSAEFSSGELRQVAWAYEPRVGVELSAEFVGGALALPVVTYSPLVGVELTAAFASGELKDVVTKYQPRLGVRLAAEFHVGELADIGVRIEPAIGVQLSAEFIGGVYEPA